MKAGTVIRTAFVAGATCFVVWRITPLIDKLSALSDGLDAGGLTALMADGRTSPQGRAATGSDELVLYSPKGENLSEAERQRLLAAAARLRPRPPDQPQPRVSLPGHDPVVMTDEPAPTETVDLEQLIDPATVQAVLEQLQSGQ